ncbi:hypothetical protein N431DRAFT_541051 [Stipitochalara longipes BDJ]|nr:hypothetical protein N431DRAFT_541051 [Stipitochalara longipes BDJ]
MAGTSTSEEEHIFFKLPPEIRHQIYRLLFVPKDEKAWIHTTILECSRRFNDDGTLILYRENTFKLEWFIGTTSLLHIWAPDSEKFSLVTKMTISRAIHSERVNLLLPKFPAICEVEIQLGSDGAKLLHSLRDQLDRIEKVVLVLLVTSSEREGAIDISKATADNILREQCKNGYGDVLDVAGGYLNRGMRMEYRPPKAGFVRFGAPGILRLTLEKEADLLTRNSQIDTEGQ